MNRKQFGGKVTKHWLSQYETSPHWQQGMFRNLMPTQTAINWKQLPGIICKQIKGHPKGYPTDSLHVERFDQKKFLDSSSDTKFIWYGHSAVLMRINGLNVLIDPMLGPDASPIAPTKTRRFSGNTLSLIDDLPEIDLMLLSHDHYDHLDFESIRRLQQKTKKYFVALGVKRHLVSWGIEADAVTEFDWWHQHVLGDMLITFTPTRHFSGRGLSSLSKCLWGGWAIRSAKENIWFSGDSGYGDHFKEIGEKLGPFDFAMMECGQYNDDWPEIHMFPDQSVQAALDAGVRKAMPVHWAGFNLSYQHGWSEPADVFVDHANNTSLDVLTPQLGKVFTLQSATDRWWAVSS